MVSQRSELIALRAFSAVAGAMPWGAGQYRIASPYAARKRWPEGFIAETNLNGARLGLDLSDRTQLIAFMLRGYTGPEYIASRLPDNGTFFDVGGHVGMITFQVAALKPDAAIHAFEPNPANAIRWHANHALNASERVRLTEAAVSDHDGDLQFAVPTDSVSGMADRAGTMVVPAVTIDSYCRDHGVERVDVLKIDVQGHEPAVLRGAARMLGEGRIGTVICEICEPLLHLAGEGTEAITEPLASYGFKARPMPEIGLRRFLPAFLGQRSDQEVVDLAFER